MHQSGGGKIKPFLRSISPNFSYNSFISNSNGEVPKHFK